MALHFNDVIVYMRLYLLLSYVMIAFCFVTSIAHIRTSIPNESKEI